MVLTWIGDVRPLLEESCYREYWRRLPDFRQKKADRCRSSMGRAQSVGVWILWQRAQKQLGLSPEAVFNLSHSGYYALCSAETEAGGDVLAGCDVERVSVYRERVAQRFFCPEEYDFIQAQKSPEGRRRMFFRYWTLKESFIKATRQGMGLALDSFSIQVEDGAHPALEKCPAPYQDKNFYFREFALEGYQAAVCSTDPEINACLRWAHF